MAEIDITKKNVTRYLGNHIVTYDNEVLDGWYGPWNSFKEMVEVVMNEGDSIDESEVDEYLSEIGVGVTVGIYENDKVVEYWKPIIDGGFVRKKSCDVVSNYSTAKILAVTDNIGSIIKVNNDETIDGILYESGFYIVIDDGVLYKFGVSSTPDAMMSNLDVYGEEDDSNKYVSNVTKKDGTIYPIKKDLDTSSVLMSGNDYSNDDTFIEVVGNVGGLSTGDKILKGSSLDELLKRLLTKEIDVKIGEAPSVRLLGYPSGSIYEIGTTVSGRLSYEYKTGLFVGETDEYITEQEADCRIVDVNYSPSEEYNVKLNDESDKIFSVSILHTSSDANGVKPLTNLGNESSLIITSGIVTDKKIIKGAYKFFYGNLDYNECSNYNEVIINDNVYNNITSKYQGWTSNPYMGECSNGASQIFFCFCPYEYTLYGEQIGTSIKPLVNCNKYAYNLPDGTYHDYVLYIWNTVKQKYSNVCIKKI